MPSFEARVSLAAYIRDFSEQMNDIFRGKEGTIQEKSLAVLFFLFPVLSVAVEHWVSGIFVLIAIACLFYLRSEQPEFSRNECIFLGIVVFYVLSTVISNTVNGWPESSVRWFEATSKFVFTIPIYLFLRTRPWILLYLFRGIPLAGVITGVYVTVMTFMEGGRVYGPYNPIFIGNMAVLIAAISLATLHYPTFPSGIRVPIHLLGCVMAISSIVLSGTRIAWLVAILVLPFAAYLAIQRLDNRRLRIRIVAGILAVIGTVISVGVILQPKLTQDRMLAAFEQSMGYFSTETLDERDDASGTSVGIRLEQWRAGMLIFAEKPLFGTGVGNVGPEINRLIDEGRISISIGIADGDESRPIHLHSAYFDTLAFKGIIGVCALLLLLAHPVWVGWRERAYYNLGLGGNGFLIIVGMAFIVISITVDPFIRNNYTSMYLLFLASALSLVHAENREALMRRGDPQARTVR